MRLTVVAPLVFALIGISSYPVHAQAEPPIGVRASGMGGAFVAVADDASAVYWNPAGLASGSYFSLIIDDNLLHTPADATAVHGRSGFLVAVGTPPLGLSFYRSRVTRTRPLAIDPAAAGRNTLQGAVRLDTLLTNQAGVSLLQSIGRVFAVGATVKYVRGSAATAVTVATGKDTLDSAEHLPSVSSAKFDADLGVMAAGSLGRVGVAVRNVSEPAFESTPGSDPIVLQRRVRGGVALNVTQTLILAADADFTKAEVSGRQWRDAAIGTEAKLLPGAWVRSGIHWNTADGATGPGAAPIVSVGGSYAVRGSVLADAQWSFGSKNGDRGWGAGVRFVF